jgi:hypothetical protein
MGRVIENTLALALQLPIVMKLGLVIFDLIKVGGVRSTTSNLVSNGMESPPLVAAFGMRCGRRRHWHCLDGRIVIGPKPTPVAKHRRSVIRMNAMPPSSG